MPRRVRYACAYFCAALHVTVASPRDYWPSMFRVQRPGLYPAAARLHGLLVGELNYRQALDLRFAGTRLINIVLPATSSAPK